VQHDTNLNTKTQRKHKKNKPVEVWLLCMTSGFEMIGSILISLRHARDQGGTPQWKRPTQKMDWLN